MNKKTTVYKSIEMPAYYIYNFDKTSSKFVITYLQKSILHKCYYILFYKSLPNTIFSIKK